MNKNFFTINLILIILTLIFSYNKVLSFENKIEVLVDDKIITTIDINNEISYLKALNVNLKSLDDNKMFEIAKTSLIRERIKEIEISKLKYKKVDENYLENVITSIYKNIGFNNKEDFLIYIENQNINISTIEQLEESLNNCNIIFDPNYLTFKEIIRCIDNLKNKNKINFWFLSSDNTYMIKAGGMNQKGNTVFL